MTKVILRAKIGENIRKERQARNMSIEELAELLELTPGFVGLIERGRRGATAYTLYKLSDIFSIPIDTIFSKTSVRSSDRKPDDKKANGAKTKRTKVSSLISDFTETELDFIISMVKNMKLISAANPVREG